MVNEIESIKIDGNVVYGVEQMAYSVNGVKDLNLGDAIAHVSLNRAVATEEVASSFAKALKLRHKKLEDLGRAMALITEDISRLAGKKVTTKVGKNLEVMTIAKRYGINRSIETLGDWQKLQSDLQYAIDREDNDLQQDMVTLQSLGSKRDQAYSTASSLMKKFNKGLADTIRQIGN